MKERILILVNHEITIYNFRKELVSDLIINGYDVYIASPGGQKIDFFKQLGCKHVSIEVDRRGSNPINDLLLLYKYYRAIKKIKPDLIMTYTIKPNIYGGLAARMSKSKIIHTVTGLGSVFVQELKIKNIVVWLNKLSFRHADNIFFLNEDNKTFYIEESIINKSNLTTIVPGSGVNTNYYTGVPLTYSNTTTFTFIGRILKDKGIDEFLSAAKRIKGSYVDVEFNIVGFIEEDRYLTILKEYEGKGIINYIGELKDVRGIIEDSSCVVLPSYGEGRGTVLQEAASMSRAIITTDTYGCRENVEDGFNGYLCQVKSTSSLASSMEKFIELSFEEKKQLGINGRIKACNEFDRKLVTSSYIKKIEVILNKRRQI